MLTKHQITEYIPQRAPIIMVDALLGLDSDFAETSFYIEEDNIFLDEGFLSVYGMIEHVAQSYALIHGYKYGCNIGVIGRISNLDFFLNPKSKAAIHSKIKIIRDMGSMVRIQASCYQEFVLLLECEMDLYFSN